MKYTEFFFNKVLAKAQYDTVKNLELISTSLAYRREVQISVYAALQELKGQERRLGFSNMPTICGYEEAMAMLALTEPPKATEAEHYLKHQAIAKLRFGIRSYTANLGLMTKPKQQAQPVHPLSSDLERPAKVVDLYAQKLLYAGNRPSDNRLCFGERGTLKNPKPVEDIADYVVDFTVSCA
jgi:hypothetical protein